MDIDFHYYGTYVAACYAGYSTKEAQTIAHAAQYVDDSTPSRLINQGDSGMDFKPIPTSQDFVKDLGWTLGFPQGEVAHVLSDIRKVWVPFHFLPGNYKSNLLPDYNSDERIREYLGPRNYLFPIWEYDSKAELEFKLLCIPNSPMSIAMINEIVNKYNGDPYELYLTGIRMHVLADTVAHAYYAGTPAWHVNDRDSAVNYINENKVDENKWDKIPFSLFGAVTKGYEMCTPDAPTYTSIFYLGHGRMGHVPDMPWIQYKYTPKWLEKSKDKIITKDNPTEYLKMFITMVTALKCIKTNKEFNSLKTEPDASINLEVIEKILKAKQNFGDINASETRSNLWKEAIKNGSFGPQVSMPENYDEDVWLNTAKVKGSAVDTDYYKFNKAAIMHLNFVQESLINDGVIQNWDF